ncbi:hypothetical protein CRG98_026301 [Punica granatum]|uniref:F-box/LRR-repeat protein At5g63520 n=1 Tax=Punica granatum TaxID=22663 RepID=A0A2I0JB70_PUNGR|nr:hypothetical protein CRG98_026301 [Punica granatum]
MAVSSPGTSSRPRTRNDHYSEPFFALCHGDLLHNVLHRLPARSFASAACVCKTWHRVSNQILCRPLLASALSLNPSPFGALLEVLDKVLSDPIRPHFAIVNVATDCDLSSMLKLTSKRLGTATPIVVSYSVGIIGRHASTDEVLEVQRGDDDNGGRGVALTVGFVPGLKVDAIPLMQQREGTILVDEFVLDIRQFSASVSGQQLPVGIVMFGNGHCDLKHAIEKLDFAMPVETAVVGDERSHFVYQTVVKKRSFFDSDGGQGYINNAVALTFVRDRNNIHGLGEIKFHVALSEGVSALGPIYKAASVRTSDHSTWLTARREGSREILDGQRMMMNIDEELNNRIGHPDLYIGVTKRRKYAIGSEKADAAVASSTCEKVSASLERLNMGVPASNSHQTVATSSPAAKESVRKEEVFGGFIFSCCGRSEYFFGRPNVDSSPFIKSLPGVPFAGVFCSGEIGRCSGSLMEQNPEGGTPVNPCSHVYSSIYLVMTYTPPPSPAEQ